MRDHDIKSLDELDDRITSIGKLKVHVKDAYDLAIYDKAAFIMLRKTGLGGSDSSIVLRSNPFRTPEDLIKDKTALKPTHEELSISEKTNVRKGSDLEPIILGKAADWLGESVYKPTSMYRFYNPECLTVNYDGVLFKQSATIPVEAKLVTQYAEKYWDTSKALCSAIDVNIPKLTGGTLEQHIAESARLYGIPAYYYTQLQQEMLGLDAPYAYLAAMFDKAWEFKMFMVYKDEFVQDMLLIEGKRLWDEIEQRKNRV